MEKKLEIIMADDHPIFRSGLKQIIETDKNIIIKGECDNGLKAMEMIIEHSPDIALLDIDMPKMTGLEVLRKLKDSDTKIIFLTMYAEEDIFDEAMNLGVKGYVLKDSAVNDIIKCIWSVWEDNYFISPSVSNFAVNRRKRLNELKSNTPSLENLTQTELRILKFISKNKTSKEIAKDLFLSPRTIENHRTNISNKLNLRGSHSLIKFAIENKSVLSDL